MAAPGYRARARQACLTCKTRKKKCNRVLPSCNYCIEKDLDCHYIPASRGLNHTYPATNSSTHTSTRCGLSTTEIDHGFASSDMGLAGPVTTKAKLYRPLSECLEGIYTEVRNIIRSTGQFVDDITTRYFRTFHHHLPIISRTRFQNSLIASVVGPSADSSVLLLSICLVTALPTPELAPRNEETPAINRRSLYLATKALLAQVQGSLPASVHLIQANLLVAVFEYGSGRLGAAYATIAGCARMAYAAQIHDSSRWDENSSLQVEAEEARNTWWGIVIYERIFCCEVGAFQQPLVTTLPSSDARLPIERDVLDRGDLLSAVFIPSILVSCQTSAIIGGFGRTAQAACLLDQVIRGVSIPDLDSRLILLQGLDGALQAFLALILPHCRGQTGATCGAIATTVRGLYMLHWHILDIPQQTVSARFQSLEEWQKSSLAALDIITKMIVDTVECHYVSTLPDMIDTVSPNHIYTGRAAIKHMRTRPYSGGTPWLESAEDTLQLHLNRICRRWDAVHD
ncbi:hypothetical protein F5Y19DRAFT_477016 [Xylariaceae sp. FL1651]|nr:hypothetical protein F5Y19DRAFT_477016 [Xylariaceae sp. FL1651]